MDIFSYDSTELHGGYTELHGEISLCKLRACFVQLGDTAWQKIIRAAACHCMGFFVETDELSTFLELKNLGNDMLKKGSPTLHSFSDVAVPPGVLGGGGCLGNLLPFSNAACSRF